MNNDLWREHVEESFDEHGVYATLEQALGIADDIRLAVESTHLASGPPIEYQDPEKSEVRLLQRELKEERDKRGCPDCRGRGYNYFLLPGGAHGSYDRCDTCGGEGKI